MTYITDIKQAQTVLNENDVHLITFDHNIRYDSDLASMYFDEFVSNASGCNEVQLFDNYVVIYGYGVKTTDKHFKKSQLAKMKKADLIELCYEYQFNVSDDDTKADLIHELLSIDHEDYYKRHYANLCYNDLDYDFSFTGYSQGHYYKVKTVGKVEEWLNSDYLTNIFYDAPIAGTIEIMVNGETIEELYLDEFIENEYAYWDKKDFIASLANYVKDKDYKDLLIEYCENNLRNYLEY